jgi:acyl-CoA thioester hydrolase
MGVAYHGHYLVWFELGRTELMRQLGCPYAEVEDRAGLFFPVIEARARYLAPARYDDVLELRTDIAEVGGVRIRFDYRLSRGDEVLATGSTEHAAVGRNGRPVRLPAGIRRRLLGDGATS